MRVLGIDPGLTRCGLGVVEGTPGRPLSLVGVGVIRTAADQPVAQRLVAIEAGIEEWLDRHRPDAVGRPVAKFGFVLVGDPSGLVAALVGDRGEQAVPLTADAGIVGIGLRPAAGINEA